MPRYTLLRQDRTLHTPPGSSGEFSSVKVSFPPIRHPDGHPVTFVCEDGEYALAEARRTYPDLREILLAVEPYSEEKHGRLNPRIQ